MGQAKWRMRPVGRISLSWVTQGFSRASDETREKITPFFFARDRIEGTEKRDWLDTDKCMAKSRWYNRPDPVWYAALFRIF